MLQYVYYILIITRFDIISHKSQLNRSSLVVGISNNTYGNIPIFIDEFAGPIIYPTSVVLNLF